MDIMARVKHENIVAFRGLCLSMDPAAAALVTAFATGGELGDALYKKHSIRNVCSMASPAGRDRRQRRPRQWAQTTPMPPPPATRGALLAAVSTSLAIATTLPTPLAVRAIMITLSERFLIVWPRVRVGAICLCVRDLFRSKVLVGRYR